MYTTTDYTYTSDGLAIFGGAFLFITFILLILTIAGLWKTFQKAGRGGWEVLIPIYNVIVMFQIAKLDLWMIILLLIPFVNIIVSILFAVKLAEAFGKDIGFAIILFLFPFIGYMLLGFGDAEYIA